MYRRMNRRVKNHPLASCSRLVHAARAPRHLLARKIESSVCLTAPTASGPHGPRAANWAALEAVVSEMRIVFLASHSAGLKVVLVTALRVAGIPRSVGKATADVTSPLIAIRRTFAARPAGATATSCLLSSDASPGDSEDVTTLGCTSNSTRFFEGREAEAVTVADSARATDTSTRSVSSATTTEVGVVLVDAATGASKGADVAISGTYVSSQETRFL